jgi:hypothetical protein
MDKYGKSPDTSKKQKPVKQKPVIKKVQIIKIMMILTHLIRKVFMTLKKAMIKKIINILKMK